MRKDKLIERKGPPILTWEEKRVSKMKKEELKVRIEQLLTKYQKLLNKLADDQTELRRLRREVQSLVGQNQNLILESSGFLILSLDTDFLDRLNNLDLSRDKEHTTELLKLLAKNQNVVKNKGE